MELNFVDTGMAVWFGILTSISPCPLATNIAAISFLGKEVSNTKNALFSGLLYTLGRTATYLVLGVILVISSKMIPSVSMFLQMHINSFLGPLLIVAGLFLVDIIPISFGKRLISEKAQQKLAGTGLTGSFLLGVILALAFCPVSAALFFGCTIGLAIKHSSMILIPSLYGIGTALPVLLFAGIIAFSVQAIGRAFKNITIFDRWARRTSAVIIIGAGIYMILGHNLQLF